MTKNKDVFLHDPTAMAKLPNDGVAHVGRPTTGEEWDVLRFELKNFVCEGEYRRGLERILSSYLANLHEDRQPAVWVSGFYGSGKTHFVRVLEALWQDIQFPDGVTARSLVPPLPDDIAADLKELSTIGKREGGLWSASGTLGSGTGGSFRLAFLSILHHSAGLPTTSYGPAKFITWLRRKGLEEQFLAKLGELGGGPDEFDDLYVSPLIARALLAVIPDFASDEVSVKLLIAEQFPTLEDVDDKTLLRDVEQLLELQFVGKPPRSGPKVPCTLIVLDELQQFIGDDNVRLDHVQSIVQACTAKFGSRLLFVATGQSALQASPMLSKLQDRLTVRVHLSDKDVETVVREVLLRKAPDKKTELEQTLEQSSGEIFRHLAGSKIGPQDADKPDLVPDYPLLPTRRRFWERTLRAVDRGAAGQLRSQLRVTFGALQRVAEDPLGTVVPADFLFDEKRSDMLSNGVLLRELDETIGRLHDGTPEGELQARLCATIFLIGRLPDDLGVRSTAEFLADLLVGELPAGSAELRRRIPEVLEPLVGSVLSEVDGEYRLQTREDAEWEQDFQKHLTQIRADDGRMAHERSAELRKASEQALRTVSITQGESRTARRLQLHFGDIPPQSEGAIPVWVRDGWSQTEQSLREEAAKLGLDSPVVAVFLPKIDAEQLKERLASYLAADETLAGHPVPTTDEGREARRVTESRRVEARERLDRHVAEILSNATVLLGGPTEPSGSTLVQKVEAAMRDAAARLYPRFSDADHSSWDIVIARAREGAGDALAAVGHNDEAATHAVCREILAFVGPGKKGSEVHKEFDQHPYGWPRDAVNAGLLALLAAGNLSARQDGVPVTAKQLTLPKVGVTEFRVETITVSAAHRIQLRRFLQEHGFPTEADREESGILRLLHELTALAERAGGPAPAPEPPSVARIQELRALTGNTLLAAVYEGRDELKALANEWRTRADLIARRQPRWTLLMQLAGHGGGLPAHERAAEQLRAIESERRLLDEPDPIEPLVQQLASALRDALNQAYAEVEEAHAQAMRTLERTDAWQGIGQKARDELVIRHRLAAPSKPDVSTAETLLRALGDVPLPSWKDQGEALAQRGERARLDAARQAEPAASVVELPRRTLHFADEADAYAEEVRALLKEQLGNGPVVIR